LATVLELVEAVARHAGEPLAHVQPIARELLNHEILPKSSGRRIAHVDAERAALLLFAVLGARRIKDAAATARAYADLVLVQAEEAADAGPPPPTALAAVASIITDYGGGFRGSRFGYVFVEVTLSWPEVRVYAAPHPDSTKSIPRWLYARGELDAVVDSTIFPKKAVTIPGRCLAGIAQRLFGAQNEAA
jgi:hypothetical protein